MNIVVHVDLDSLGPTSCNDIVQSSTQSPAELIRNHLFKNVCYSFKICNNICRLYLQYSYHEPNARKYFLKYLLLHSSLIQYHVKLTSSESLTIEAQ